MLGKTEIATMPAGKIHGRHALAAFRLHFSQRNGSLPAAYQNALVKHPANSGRQVQMIQNLYGRKNFDPSPCSNVAKVPGQG